MKETRKSFTDPLWGRSAMVFEHDNSQPDALVTWGERLEAAMHEAKAVDAYKIQANLDDEDFQAVDQEVAVVIKEGFIRKSKKGESKTVHGFGLKNWEVLYMVLSNDGRLRFFESKARKLSRRWSKAAATRPEAARTSSGTC